MYTPAPWYDNRFDFAWSLFGALLGGLLVSLAHGASVESLHWSIGWTIVFLIGLIVGSIIGWSYGFLLFESILLIIVSVFVSNLLWSMSFVCVLLAKIGVDFTVE